MHERSPRVYTTRDRLIEIIGHASPISRGDLPSNEDLGLNGLDEEDLQPIPWTDLIPAETVSAYVYPKADGMVEIEYYAWANVWPQLTDFQPRALLNEVRGRFRFDEHDLRIAPAVAEILASELYPYRLTPETHVSGSTVTGGHSFFERLRRKVFGIPACAEPNALTQAIEAELRRLAEAEPPSSASKDPRAREES